MSLRKKLDKLIKNRPKYEIKSEIFDNQAIATNAAYGRSSAVVNAETQVTQNAANAISQAQQSSASGAGLLAAAAGINANSNAANTNLANQEAQIQAEGKQQLMAANAAVIEEKDKAWDYNVNQPYQNKIQELRDRRKARQELLMKGLDVVGGVVGTAVGAKLCWVAREIYGEDNPQWHLFRIWLVQFAPKWFRDLYTIHGEQFARFLKQNPFIKPFIKPFFDSKVRYINRLVDGLQRV